MKKIFSLFIVLILLTSALCACDTVKITRGETSATSYKNDSINLNFTKPENWRFYTDDEIAASMNITKDLFKDKDALNSSKISSLTEFMVIDDSTGNNVNMTLENLKNSGSEKISLEDFAEKAKKAFKEQITGMVYNFGTDSKVTLGGQEYLRLTATCSYSGVNMTQYIYLRKVGTYMVSVTATSVTGLSAETFEGMFS